MSKVLKAARIFLQYFLHLVPNSHNLENIVNLSKLKPTYAVLSYRRSLRLPEYHSAHDCGSCRRRVNRPGRVFLPPLRRSNGNTNHTGKDPDKIHSSGDI